MSHLLEFIEIVRSYWESVVTLFVVAILTWAFGHLYAIRSGTEGVPWYGSLIIFLSLFPVIGFRIWLTQKQQHEKEVQNLKDSHQQTKDTLHQQIATLKDQLDTRARHKEQRETLTRYLTRSNELINIYTSSEDVPSEPHDEWAYGIANYLQASFDKSYFARWDDPIGIPSYFSMRQEVSKENERFLRDIYWRTLRLRELMADLKD